jgi:teichuronic acid biosynthesis glycosyltransferase TuaC
MLSTATHAAGTPTRIALVTPMLPVPYDPTRGRYIYEIARSLSRLTPTRVFLQQARYPRLRLLQTHRFIYGIAGEGYELDGIDVEAFSYPAVRLISRPFNSWSSSRVLLPRLRAFAPDVILAYWVVPEGHAATIAARALSVPAVVGALGSDIYVDSRLNAWLVRRTLRSASAVLAVAAQMRDILVSRYGAKAQCVYTIVNGFNREIFYPRSQPQMRLKLGLAADVRLIIYVGRLVQTKGLQELMSAFNSLAVRDSRLQLAIIGQGAMHAELAAAAEADGCAQRVHLLGALSPQAVAEWIGAADLLCLPSWSEGYPNVVVEAIACGRPVVATDVGGTAEIVNAASGLLVPPRDPPRLQAALAAALERRWDHAAIAAAFRRSWDDVARETLEVCARAVRDWRATRPLRP